MWYMRVPMVVDLWCGLATLLIAGDLGLAGDEGESKRSYRFRGTFENGEFAGTHAKGSTEGEPRDLGTLTLLYSPSWPLLPMLPGLGARVG